MKTLLAQCLAQSIHPVSTWLLLLLYRVGDTVCLVPWVSLCCPQNIEQCAKSSIVLRRGPSTVVGLWGGFQKHPSFPAVGRNKKPRRCSLECGPLHPTPDPTLPTRWCSRSILGEKISLPPASQSRHGSLPCCYSSCWSLGRDIPFSGVELSKWILKYGLYFNFWLFSKFGHNHVVLL